MRKGFTLMVMGATALSSVLSTAAWADTIPDPVAEPANITTLGLMQDQCDILADAHDTANSDKWSGVVVPGLVTLYSGPTEVEGSRVPDESTIVHKGTFTPGTTYIEGEPFRIGGSVNMFGDQWASSGTWSDSEYDYTADFDSTFRHAYSCGIYQEVYHEGYEVHHPAVGIYVVYGDFGSSEDAVRGNCAAFSTQTDEDWFGEPFHGGNDEKPHCKFEGTAAYDEVVDEHWDAPVLIATEDGGYVDQDQTDSLLAHEDHGGPVMAEGGPFHIGQVVICISPSSTTKKGVPGEWRGQNGYTGANCTTDWFKNHAVWGSGTESSNGTYISVPDYHL